SWPAPQRVEVCQRVLWFPRDASGHLASTHGDEVAPVAGVFVRRRREEAVLNGAIDDAQHVNARAAVRVAEWNLVLRKAACRCAIEQSSTSNRGPERFLDDHRIQDGLQHCAAADDRLLDAVRLAPRLV